MNGTKSSAAWGRIDVNTEHDLSPATVCSIPDDELAVNPARRCRTTASKRAAAALFPPSGAAAASGERAYRAIEIRYHQTDTDDLAEQVGAPRTGSVSCCHCQAQLEVPCMGYGDLVRRAEAAGWHYRPARHGRERAWCPRCQHDAGSAA